MSVAEYEIRRLKNTSSSGSKVFATSASFPLALHHVARSSPKSWRFRAASLLLSFSLSTPPHVTEYHGISLTDGILARHSRSLQAISFHLVVRLWGRGAARL